MSLGNGPVRFQLSVSWLLPHLEVDNDPRQESVAQVGTETLHLPLFLKKMDRGNGGPLDLYAHGTFYGTGDIFARWLGHVERNERRELPDGQRQLVTRIVLRNVLPQELIEHIASYLREMRLKCAGCSKWGSRRYGVVEDDCVFCSEKCRLSKELADIMDIYRRH